MMRQGVSLPRVTAASDSSRIATELASRRTGMSFQRTRMSADRTLLSVIHTSLSLIAFGFAIYQLFTLAQAARSFGTTLVVVGIVLLALGIFFHVRFISGLRDARTEMMADGLIHGPSAFPRSLVLITAVLLLLIGVAAMISMVYHVGPFD